MQKNILFDLYGTLINIHTSEEGIIFWDNVKDSLYPNSTLSSSEIKNKYLSLCKVYSKNYEEIDILDVFSDMNNGDVSKALADAVEFRRLSTCYIGLYPGVKECLIELKNLGYKIYVLSNAQRIFTMPELIKLGIKDLFDGIAISSDYGFKKPNLKFYKMAMKNFNISSGIMVGNEYECDVLPALELGLGSVFIYSNLTPRYPDYKERANLIDFNKDKLIKIITDLS